MNWLLSECKYLITGTMTSKSYSESMGMIWEEALVLARAVHYKIQVNISYLFKTRKMLGCLTLMKKARSVIQNTLIYIYILSVKKVEGMF